MKYKTLIPICLVAFSVMSWFSVFKENVTESTSYKKLEKQADESYKKELYQQAYGDYEKAFSVKQSQSIEDKILASYKAFDEEEYTEETATAYLEALYKACDRFPEVNSYWEEAIEMNIEKENFKEAMALCKKAEKADAKSDKLIELYQDVLYSYKLGNACSGYKNAVNGYFLTDTGTTKGRMASDGQNYQVLDEKEVGYVGDDGIYLSRDAEDRIRFIDLDGIIRGKVNLDVTDFGLYQEGFCAVKYQDAYGFIDLDGNILIDGLRYAGCFQNGKAVICDNEGKWALIDTEGKICSDYFEEIKVDYAGRYLFGENVIAKKDGKYGLYNSSLKKEKKELDVSEVDIPVEKGLVAYKKNEKWGFIDSTGKVKIEPAYENARSFSNGFAAVCQDGKWGLINEKGQIILDYTYNEIGYMSDKGTCYVSEQEDYYEALSFNFAEEFME